ncbi:MAG: Asp23/Gls24 family envelope stress response protein [Clostridiales bacterium]|nr:Asp23/Gls24 family envelope stress response protein [Clostridiales bacterium]
MDYKVATDIGTVFIADEVMLKIVGYAALECYGIVAMSSRQKAKDGFVEWLGRENLAKGVSIRIDGDQLDVELHIIVEYGISVAEVCKTIVEVVRYKLESMTGAKVRSVNVSVDGIRV